MRPSHLASGFLALGITLLLPADGRTQTPEDIDSITGSVTNLLHDVRQAANDGDWDAIKAYFPTSWASNVESQVTGTHSPRAVSFWQPRTRLPYGDFVIDIVAQDIVAVGANFLLGDSIGSWGAVLINDSGDWHFHCYAEMFGPWDDPPPIRTGCVRTPDPA
jgi:hypothetical protein